MIYHKNRIMVLFHSYNTLCIIRISLKVLISKMAIYAIPKKVTKTHLGLQTSGLHVLTNRSIISSKTYGSKPEHLTIAP